MKLTLSVNLPAVAACIAIGLSGQSIAFAGSLVAWGRDDDGQVTGVPIQTDFVAISAGREHGLALKGDGSIVAWGHNGYGQCNVPAPNADFVAIAGGAFHSLGLKANGSVVAWGRNNYG
ncbi:MAG: hypothetical protein IID36_01255, partial [Planctomycetes bacterium]|nr:hypothetical protein [Planctomycetota bacterium]